MTYLITYDLHNRHNYAPLLQLLASWNAAKLAESVWLANLVGPAGAVRNIIASKLDNDDTVAVVEVKHGADWATLRVNPAANAFLSAYVQRAQMAA